MKTENSKTHPGFKHQVNVPREGSAAEEAREAPDMEAMEDQQMPMKGNTITKK